MSRVISMSINLILMIGMVAAVLIYPCFLTSAAGAWQVNRSTASVSAKIEFVAIAAGEFMMGSENGDYNKKPVHKVRISRPFEMGKYEVTQAQWQAVMGNNPSKLKGASAP
jgi:formylglycine-generating enzyme required for sulfatase activity